MKTLRIPDVILLGPLEENEAMLGAGFVHVQLCYGWIDIS